MSKQVSYTKEEAQAGLVAVGYYIDTITLCTNHEPNEHGNEAECEGWGPNEYEALLRFYEKTYRVA